MSESSVTDALLEALEDTGLAIGDGEKPDGAGWQGTPGASTFVPYAVLHPLLGGFTDGTIGDPHGDYELLFQVTCVGVSRQQCQFVADAIHPIVLAFRPALDGLAIRFVDDDMLGGARRDDVVQPPLWYSTPRYRVYVTPGESLSGS